MSRPTEITEGAAVDAAGYMDMTQVANVTGKVSHNLTNSTQDSVDTRYLLEPAHNLEQAKRLQVEATGQRAYEPPQYMNAGKVTETGPDDEVIYDEDISGILEKNQVPSQSVNPIYIQTDRILDLNSDSPLPPPPPALTEDPPEKPAYADITKADSIKRGTSVKSADSVLYPRVSLQRTPAKKTFEDVPFPPASPDPGTVKESHSFLRTLLLLIGIVSLIALLALGVSVFNMMNWPSDTTTTITTTDRTGFLEQNPVSHQTAPPPGAPRNLSNTVAQSEQTDHVKEMQALRGRLSMLEQNISRLNQMIQNVPLSMLEQNISRLNQMIQNVPVEGLQRDLGTVKTQIRVLKEINNQTEGKVDLLDKAVSASLRYDKIVDKLHNVTSKGETSFLGDCTVETRFCYTTPPEYCNTGLYLYVPLGYTGAGVHCDADHALGVTSIQIKEFQDNNQIYYGYRCHCFYLERQHAYLAKKSVTCKLNVHKCKKVRLQL